MLAAMPPRYNMEPSQPLPIIREPGTLGLVRWGLPKQSHGLGVNVRVETVARAPAYRYGPSWPSRLANRH